MMQAHLSPKLREEYGVSSLPLREGDTVRIERGDPRGLEGKITVVDRDSYRVGVEGLTREKQSGESSPIMFHHSNLTIVELDTSDVYRQERLEELKEG